MTTKTKAKLQLETAERTMDCGLTLLAVRGAAETFASTLVLDVGARDEKPGEEGIASFAGACLDEGTASHDALQLAEALESIGGSIGPQSNGGSVSAPASEARKALGFLHDVVLKPSFPSREVNRVRQETLTEIQADLADARTVASQRFREEVFGAKHPSGRPDHGGPDQVESFKPGGLRRWHAKWFVPHGGIMAAASPDDPERTLDLLERTMKGFRGKEIKHAEVPEVPLPDARREVHVPMEREQVHVFLGHGGIERAHPDFYALQVMDHVLGSGPGFTSRIARKLRDEQGLCYSVGAGISSSAGRYAGVFAAYIGTSAKDRKAAIAGFFKEIDTIRKELVTVEELEDVKRYLTGSYVFAFERSGNLAAWLVRAKRFELGFDHVHEYPNIIESITREDVLRVAKEHLHPSKMLTVSAGAGS